jgi:RNA polymerase sigma-70 factor (ECF subfamily)
MVDLEAHSIEQEYLEHHASLVRRLTAICRDAAAAEDLAQEAFLRLTREMAAGRGPDDVPAWLYRVGANLATSRGRRLAVAERHRAGLVGPAMDEDPAVDVLQDELRAALRTALAELPATDRQAVLLAAHGYRGPEIARLVHRSPGATRMLLWRARSRLRDHLVAGGFATI